MNEKNEIKDNGSLREIVVRIEVKKIYLFAIIAEDTKRASLMAHSILKNRDKNKELVTKSLIGDGFTTEIISSKEVDKNLVKNVKNKQEK